MRRLTVLSGPAWPLPGAARRWLAVEPAYVRIEILDPASPSARARWPSLPSPTASDDLAVLADDGRLWRGPRAWFVLLWALRRYRATALSLARTGGVGSARRLARAMFQRAGGPPGSGGTANASWLRATIYAFGVVPWVAGAALALPAEPGLAGTLAILFVLLVWFPKTFVAASAILGAYLIEPGYVWVAALLLILFGIPLLALFRAEARGTARR